MKAIASLLIAFSILLNAFGEHYLKLDPYQKSLIFKATFYLIISSLSVFVMSDLSSKIVLLGGLIFSFSLILIVFTGIKIFGAITPIGGLLLIFAWILQAYYFYKES